MDDQKLTIFIPAEKQDNLKQSLQQELRIVEARLRQCYKIVVIAQPFSIQRETGKDVAGSSIYYKYNGRPNKVTAGALFVDLINHKVYLLTTCHLNEATNEPFYFKDSDGDILLGKCVAYICQTNPVIEACLVELHRDSWCKFSPLLSTHDSATKSAFCGPYRGSLSELLAAPKEVMKCGASSGLTRGKMKYFAYDFPDPSTNTMIYGGIVTLPVDTSQQFSLPGDSGSIISTASAQPYFVKWGYFWWDFLEINEVMAHEALSVHCFGYRMTLPEYGSVKASISFRVTLAIEKLQEQIGAELTLLPRLQKE